MTTPPADALVGTMIAHYHVLARIGGGGMGVVYSARDTRLGRLVALKFLPAQWSHDEGAKQRFIREAQAASATDHPNICTIHDIGATDDGRLFIVMAHYDGRTLKQMLEGGRLEIEAAVEIAAQVAEALAKAHAAGVVHRDIKPGNLMVCGDTVKILDFGLAKFATALQLTIEGSTLGTAAYMSPEQVKGEEADARSDVWSLGVVLYEMLAGRVPFQGAYPEAVAYAIRNEAAPSLRALRPEVPEALEQIVFRAMHKEPAVRYRAARDLARALRGLQGRTIAEDLLTVPLAIPPAGAVTPAVAAAPPAAPGPRRPRALWVAAAAAVLFIGAPLWVLAPVERTPVAVVPFANQTGYAELDAYRMALTQELIAELADARGIRVLPYERLLQIVRRFRAAGQDVASREAVQAVAQQSGASTLIVPTLLYRNGEWKARLDFRDPQTTTNQGETFETPGVVSSLMKEAVYGLTPSLAAATVEHFLDRGPWRAGLAERLRRMTGRTRSPAVQLASLDAAAAFEQGLDAFEQFDLATARDAFTRAAERDPRHPVPVAWRARVAGLLRQDREAASSADAALRLAPTAVRAADRELVTAIAAESRRDAEGARRAYAALVERYPDEPAWLLELAAFEDRQGRTTEAINAYHRALQMDGRLPRPRVELCRIYSPSRLNEPAAAKEQGRAALARYQALGNAAGELQALWCLTDVLRAGNDADRPQARQHAERALAIARRLGQPFALGRAYNYMALVALSAERDGRQAAQHLEKALNAARATGFVLLEGRTLMNLGVAHELVGERTAAVKYYRDSFALFEAMGNEQDAAWMQANAAAILIDYGGGPDEGLRDARNALVVFEKLGDRYFEVFVRRMIASYHRNAGHAEEALRELTRAQSIARERGLADREAQVAIDLARLRLDAGDFAGARDILQGVLGKATGTDAIHARIELGRALTGLRQFDAAAAALSAADAEVRRHRDDGSQPLLRLAQGELAFARGDLRGARAAFADAAAAWTDDLPEAASVEAAAYVGYLDARAGSTARGRAAVTRSLEQARRMRRVALEARCRMFLDDIDARRTITHG